MKNLKNNNILKTLLLVGCVAITFAISSCGDKQTAASDNAAPAQSMIPDQPKDDGQGIGRFKNVTVSAIDEKLATAGQIVFEAKCSACHNPTATKKVGPGLLGVTTRRQPAWILNQITNPAEMTQKDPTSKALLAQYLTQMTFQDVTDDQARSILEFFRHNDASGPEQAKK
jgi:mono/diheme cytochrome c family protein